MRTAPPPTAAGVPHAEFLSRLPGDFEPRRTLPPSVVASSSPTWRGLPKMLPHFTTNEARANNGSKRARGRSNGRGCPVARSPPTPFVFSSMPSRIISATSYALWRARTNQGLVADEPQRETHQDGREGRAPRPLCRFPNGRGRRSETSVRRRPSAHRGTAAAAGHVNSVTKLSLSRVPRKTTGDLRLDDKNRHSPARDREPARPGSVSANRGGVATTFQCCQSFAMGAVSAALGPSIWRMPVEGIS